MKDESNSERNDQNKEENTSITTSSSNLRFVRDENPLFAGRGSLAFMSTSEPAIRLLRERYNESFAFVNGTEHRVHLFVIKVSLWSLAWTFVFKEIGEDKKSALLRAALEATSAALSGKDSTLLKGLDEAVENCLERTRRVLEKYGYSPS